MFSIRDISRALFFHRDECCSSSDKETFISQVAHQFSINQYSVFLKNEGFYFLSINKLEERNPQFLGNSAESKIFQCKLHQANLKADNISRLLQIRVLISFFPKVPLSLYLYFDAQVAICEQLTRVKDPAQESCLLMEDGKV